MDTESFKKLSDQEKIVQIVIFRREFDKYKPIMNAKEIKRYQSLLDEWVSIARSNNG